MEERRHGPLLRCPSFIRGLYQYITSSSPCTITFSTSQKSLLLPTSPRADSQCSVRRDERRRDHHEDTQRLPDVRADRRPLLPH
jgi:hypothetical protein